ncbi:hypothetical protein QE152_g21539 [Popillia japonica]|uniref:C2H2-type domain-containing protein n=1 Tax=Popillia japonica TaxID=7064 RepID=A0AAW1KPA6_POPJA
MKSNIVNQQNILEDTLLFQLELADGTSQLIQVPKLEIHNLGLHIQTEPKTVQIEQVPLVTSEVAKQETLNSNVETADKINEDKVSHFVYKIIKPEDLNLKPNVKTHLTRGRPRKRVKQKRKVVATDENNSDEIDEPKKIIKQARTRSGRITKPPKHIEKHFKKIDISDDSKPETDLKTCEFEPLRTNDTPSEEPLQYLEQHSRKRNPCRFKCPICNKAYFRKIKMIHHFQKHPDHKSDAIHKLINHTTWNFLILTSQKHKLGSKGVKFCEELEVLVRNARYLAHFLFKPVETDDQGYFINENLSSLFGIASGKYKIDDSELNRDVMLYEYLENNEHCNSNEDVEKAEVKDVSKDVGTSLQTEQFNTFDYIMNDERNSIGNFDLNAAKKDFNEKSDLNLTDINLSLQTQQNHTDIEFTIPNSSHDIIIDKEQLKSNHSDPFIATQNSNTTLTNGNCLALVKYENIQPKNNFIFNNHEFNNDLHNQLDNLTTYNELQIKDKTVFGLEAPDKSHIESSEKQNSHITLQNELRDVDELMLVNVDTGQVSNILDTSSNSDDIMNVDQFVNERFKKLTEPDIDIQNNLLNLELPPLEMFHFHTS